MFRTGFLAVVLGLSASCLAQADDKAAPDDPLASDIADALWQTCIIPLRDDTAVNLEGWVRLTEAEKTQVSATLFDDWTLWRDHQSRFYLALREEGNPNPCSILTVQLPHGSGAPIWNRIKSLDGFRTDATFAPKQNKYTTKDQVRGTAGGAVHLGDNAFLNVMLSYWGTSRSGVTQADAFRIGKTPFVCELYPEFCDE